MTSGATGPGAFVDDVRAVADHYGVAAGDVVPVPNKGQVNLTVFLGDELVLRIPRNPRAAALMAKEAVVIPLVQDAGVPTPRLIAVDVTLRIATVPYVVVERLRGQTFAEQRGDRTQQGRTLHSLGEILATLHRIRRTTVGAIDEIPEPYDFPPAELLDELIEAGEIGSAQRSWLLARFGLLGPDGPPRSDPVLLHRDVIPSNVIVDPGGRVTGLLDWGSAEWGSPARDLVGLPPRMLPGLVAGYRAAAHRLGAGDGFSLERDALWYHLYLALTRLAKRPSTSEDRNWAAPRNATLIDLLAFASDTRDEPWAQLLRPQERWAKADS